MITIIQYDFNPMILLPLVVEKIQFFFSSTCAVIGVVV